MKKLLLAPFLLASLFYFGGELKAYPNSRYELPEPRNNFNNDFLGNQSSNNVWYLLNQVLVLGTTDNIDSLENFETMQIINTRSKPNCLRLARERNTWVESIDLGSFNNRMDMRYKSFYKCIKGVKDYESDSFLDISAPITYRIEGRNQFSKNSDGKHNSFNRLFFKNINQCNSAKLKLDSWFNSLEVKQKNKHQNGSGYMLKFSTKCFSKS